MTELGDDFRAWKEYKRKKRIEEGWISNRYRTEEERIKSIQESHKLNDRIDGHTLKSINKAGFKVTRKGESSFQIHTNLGNFMFYSSTKSGDFLYIPQVKERIYVSYPIEESLKHAVIRAGEILGIKK